jgi:hypothetical protein
LRCTPRLPPSQACAACVRVHALLHAPGSVPNSHLVADRPPPSPRTLSALLAARAMVPSPGFIPHPTPRHEPMHAPVAPGKYVVTVTGMTPGSYAVDVVATVGLCARDAAEEAASSIKSSQQRLKVRVALPPSHPHPAHTDPPACAHARNCACTSSWVGQRHGRALPTLPIPSLMWDRKCAPSPPPPQTRAGGGGGLTTRFRLVL